MLGKATSVYTISRSLSIVFRSIQRASPRKLKHTIITLVTLCTFTRLVKPGADILSLLHLRIRSVIPEKTRAKRSSILPPQRIYLILSNNSVNVFIMLTIYLTRHRHTSPLIIHQDIPLHRNPNQSKRCAV
ncbi:hypothetical protein OCU04_007623 [Sclerotinia nivalis]|uniref:Uncharacterized protein n=1 Tax=Sclerotinia nivalis TaxID=352851 RepID=A0A9X0AJ59_9HELO|nr:hypothetical protein OCU04_007623 [Sclerotinia nivalis]